MRAAVRSLWYPQENWMWPIWEGQAVSESIFWLIGHISRPTYDVQTSAKASVYLWIISRHGMRAVKCSENCSKQAFGRMIRTLLPSNGADIQRINWSHGCAVGKTQREKKNSGLFLVEPFFHVFKQYFTAEKNCTALPQWTVCVMFIYMMTFLFRVSVLYVILIDIILLQSKLFKQ